MQWAAIDNLPVSAAAVVAGLASLGYVVARLQLGQRRFTLLDAVTVVLLMAIVTAAAVPLLDAASYGAKQSALLQNLYTLRSQIALYKQEHGGDPPVLYQGTLPQLLQATDASGVPGPRGSQHPFGPYLPLGIPGNPLTNRSLVTPIDAFPPTAASSNGGWLFHQETGQIAIDLPDMLNR